MVQLLFLGVLCCLNPSLQGSGENSDNSERERRAGTVLTSNCGTTAVHRCGIASGWKSASLGDSSVAFGVYAKASGPGSFAQGDVSEARGEWTAAFGRYTMADGDSSMAINYNTVANASYAFAQGYRTKAVHDMSSAMGYYTMTNADHEFVVGEYNEEVSVMGDNCHLFTVGNGNATERSDAFYVTRGGNVYLSGMLYIGGKVIDFNGLELNQNKTQESLEQISSDANKRLGIQAYDILQMREEVTHINQATQDSIDDILSVASDLQNITRTEVALQGQVVSLKTDLSNLHQNFSTMQRKAEDAEARATAAESAMQSMKADITALYAMIENLQKPCNCEEKHGCRP
eukprot:m.61748 g.61748  ORF g.61748 m.61748 type:complete len:346 (-) comp11440_c0_seq1:217-1254(-)